VTIIDTKPATLIDMEPVRPAGTPAVAAAAVAGPSVAEGHPGLGPGASVWSPLSPCTAACLPEPGSEPRVSGLRVAWRMTAFTVMIGFAAALFLVLPLLWSLRSWLGRGESNGRGELPTWLFRALLRTIGVRVVRHGPADLREDAGRGALVVANHMSWLDVLAFGALGSVRMLAKHEIRYYPLIGLVAQRIGTLFIDRAELRALPGVVADVADELRAGGLVGLFPEGTTWCGTATGRFRRAGFQAALDAGAPVRPIAQRLLLPDGTRTTAGAFIGDDTVLATLLRVVALPGLTLEMRVLPLLDPAPGTDRRDLARAAELAVSAATGVRAPDGPRAAAPVALAA
jgi:1-acyl-sn-glycerol-3-phosphate acyltransferase